MKVREAVRRSSKDASGRFRARGGRGSGEHGGRKHLVLEKAVEVCLSACLEDQGTEARPSGVMRAQEVPQCK